MRFVRCIRRQRERAVRQTALPPGERGWLSLLLCGFLVALAMNSRADAIDSIDLLGPGDTVRITVFQNQDLTLEARISERGTVSFPLVGEVSLLGLTPAVAEVRIADKLRQGNFVVNPQVNLSVVQMRSRQVSLLGQVLKPGKYPLEAANSKLTDVLALAGGAASGAADKVTLITTRNGRGEKLEIDLPAMFRSGNMEQNINVVSGDIIFVQRAPVFYIYGEAQHPGSYRLEPNMIVMQALSLAGGVTLRGTARGLKINRQVKPGQVELIEAKLTDFVEPDDVIYVRESLF